MKTRNKHLGTSFEAFLKDEGIHEEVTTHAIKRVLAWQITEAMKSQGISKSQMAKRMNTSRSDRQAGRHQPRKRPPAEKRLNRSRQRGPYDRLSLTRKGIGHILVVCGHFSGRHHGEDPDRRARAQGQVERDPRARAARRDGDGDGSEPSGRRHRTCQGRRGEDVVVRTLVKSGRFAWSGGKPEGLEKAPRVRGPWVSEAVVEDRR